MHRESPFKGESIPNNPRKVCLFVFVSLPKVLTYSQLHPQLLSQINVLVVRTFNYLISHVMLNNSYLVLVAIRHQTGRSWSPSFLSFSWCGPHIQRRSNIIWYVQLRNLVIEWIRFFYFSCFLLRKDPSPKDVAIIVKLNELSLKADMYVNKMGEQFVMLYCVATVGHWLF